MVTSKATQYPTYVMHYQKLDSLFWRVHSKVEFDVHYLSKKKVIFFRILEDYMINIISCGNHAAFHAICLAKVVLF
jgi:hypothetical protein